LTAARAGGRAALAKAGNFGIIAVANTVAPTPTAIPNDVPDFNKSDNLGMDNLDLDESELQMGLFINAGVVCNKASFKTTVTKC
jgi:hypothetical protein